MKFYLTSFTLFKDTLSCFLSHWLIKMTEVSFWVWVTEEALTLQTHPQHSTSLVLAPCVNIHSIILYSLCVCQATDMSLDSRYMGMFSHNIHTLWRKLQQSAALAALKYSNIVLMCSVRAAAELARWLTFNPALPGIIWLNSIMTVGNWLLMMVSSSEDSWCKTEFTFSGSGSTSSSMVRLHQLVHKHNT